MATHLALLICTLCMICIDHLWAWSPMYLSQQSSRHGRSIFLATDDDDDGGESDKIVQDNTNQQSTASVYGVSYIGGDPCGSKYNNDPFDASKEEFKPGLPDNMKDRIEAMAAVKLQEEKERQKEK